MPRKDYEPQAEPLSKEMRDKEQKRLAGQAQAAGIRGGVVRRAAAEANDSPGADRRRKVREGMRELRAKRKGEAS